MHHLRNEGSLANTVWAELPAYWVADAATTMLFETLEDLRVEGPGDDEPHPSYWLRRAMLYLGTMALREARAVMALIAVGYEAETQPHSRTLMEVFSRAKSVLQDTSGGYAKEWLTKGAGTPRKAFSKLDADDLWKMMSHGSHADRRGVESMYAVTDEIGHTGLLLSPERRPEVSGAMLSMTAGQARDIASMVALTFGRDLPRLAQLDTQLKALPLYQQDADDEQ